MPDQKLDNLLNLAMDATEEEREKSRNLNVGYEKQTRKWEIIVKYSEALPGGSEISVVSLLGGYAIVTIPESMLDEYSRRPQIEFIEKPTRLYFEDFFSKEASCITQVQRNEPGNLQLTGHGVLIGIVDSGVDYRHLAFLTACSLLCGLVENSRCQALFACMAEAVKCMAAITALYFELLTVGVGLLMMMGGG